MTRWNKNETRFTVSVNYDKKKGSVIRFPKPLLEKLNNPKTLTFVIEGEKIEVASS